MENHKNSTNSKISNMENEVSGKDNLPKSKTTSSFSSLCRLDPVEPSIRVLELGQMERFMWDANVLFSLGRVEEIRSNAKALQEKGQASGYKLAFALLRLDGEKSDFEDMAVEYAVQTGNSPPVWLDIHDKNKKSATSQKRSVVKINSLLMESIFETTIKMESPWPLTLDFSDVTKTDVAGIDIFHESLIGRVSRCESTLLMNSDKLIHDVVRKIREESYKNNARLWTFCFNTYRLTGNKKSFDDLSSDFVEKTREDMPVWKDLRDKEEINRMERLNVPDISFSFDVGDSLSAINPSFFNSICESDVFKESRGQKKNLSLDFSKMKLWSLADMTEVMKFIRHSEKNLVKFDFINVNELLLGLLKGFSIDETTKMFVVGESE